MRRSALFTLSILILIACETLAQTEWPVYGGDPGGSKYSVLKQLSNRASRFVGLRRGESAAPFHDAKRRHGVGPRTWVAHCSVQQYPCHHPADSVGKLGGRESGQPTRSRNQCTERRAFRHVAPVAVFTEQASVQSSAMGYARRRRYGNRK